MSVLNLAACYVDFNCSRLTYQSIRCQIERQLDFAFVFIATNTVFLVSRIDLILDENKQIPIVKGKYGSEARLLIARFWPSMPSKDFDQYLCQLKRSDVYLASFIMSDVTAPAYFVTMKQFNSKHIVNYYSKVVESILQDFNIKAFVNTIEIEYRQILDSKNDFCIDLKKVIEGHSERQNPLHLKIEPIELTLKCWSVSIC